MISKISRQTVYLFNIISVLLLSILANHIFSANIDFSMSIDWIFICKTVFLFISVIFFYFSVLELEKLKKISEQEFYKDSNTNRAESSIDDRFKEKLRKKINTKPIESKLIIFIIFFLLYFLFEPTIKFICNK